jgi:hypothetical protein
MKGWFRNSPDFEMNGIPEIAYGRVLRYPPSTRLLYHSGVIGGIGFIVGSAYFFLFDDTTSRIFWVASICFGFALIFGSLIELFNHQMILIDELGLHTRGPNRRVSILWGDVDAILCAPSGYASSPFISYYVVSNKEKEVIKFTQEIDHFDDLCSIVSDRLRNVKVKDVGFAELARFYRQIYFAKGVKKVNEI